MNRAISPIVSLVAAFALFACDDAQLPMQPASPKLRIGFGQNISVTPSENLKQIIESAQSGDTVTLGAGDFYVTSSITIQNKSNFWIRGSGQGNTRIRPSDSVAFALLVGSNVSNLSMTDFSVIGSNPQRTHGIAMNGGTSNVSGLYFLRLEMRELVNGISVAGSSCNDVTIFRNTIVGMRARPNPEAGADNSSGSGYGIHNQGCTNVRIAENFIEETERHGIYQAVSSGPVTIEHNFILNHMKTGNVQRGANLVALTVTNTNNAAVAFNTVVNPYADAISIEYDTSSARGGSTSNVQLIGNTVIGAREADVFITAPGTWKVWGNKYYHRGTIGATATPIVRPESAASQLEEPLTRWAGTQMVAAKTPGDLIFVLQNGAFHKVTKAYTVDPDSWNYSTYSDAYGGIQAMEADSNKVYAMISNTLQELSPNSPWTSRVSPTNWSGFEAMAFSVNRLYVVQSGTLHKIDPATWSYRADGTEPRGGWGSTQALTAFDGRVFLMQNDCTHEVSPSTLWYTRYWC